jgi:hypothetical protein
VSVTIVLADGFDGEDVELTVDGRIHVVEGARTSPLTGMADELVVVAEGGPVQVSASMARPDGSRDSTAEPAPTAPAVVPLPDSSRAVFDVPMGATLVLDRCADRLEGRVHTGPVGFA